MPLGRYWRDEAVGVVVAARCQGWWGSQKTTGMPVAMVNPAWSAISRPWSHVSERQRWPGSQVTAVAEHGVYVGGGAAGGERDEHQIAGCSLDQGGHGGAATGTDDQVAFPVAGHRSIVGLGRAFSDVDHVAQLAALRRRGAGLGATLGAFERR